MAVKSSSNGKKSSFNWSSIVLRCGKIYPELVSNFEKSERASTAVGNYHIHQEELNRPALEVSYWSLLPSPPLVQTAPKKLATYLEQTLTLPKNYWLNSQEIKFKVWTFRLCNVNIKLCIFFSKHDLIISIMYAMHVNYSSELMYIHFPFCCNELWNLEKKIHEKKIATLVQNSSETTEQKYSKM